MILINFIYNKIKKNYLKAPVAEKNSRLNYLRSYVSKYAFKWLLILEEAGKTVIFEKNPDNKNCIHCNHTFRTGLPCLHQVKDITDQNLLKSLISVRWIKEFLLRAYNKSEYLKLNQGIPVSIRSFANDVGSSSIDKNVQNFNIINEDLEKIKKTKTSEYKLSFNDYREETNRLLDMVYVDRESEEKKKIRF